MLSRGLEYISIRIQNQTDQIQSVGLINIHPWLSRFKMAWGLGYVDGHGIHTHSSTQYSMCTTVYLRPLVENPSPIEAIALGNSGPSIVVLPPWLFLADSQSSSSVVKAVHPCQVCDELPAPCSL